MAPEAMIKNYITVQFIALTIHTSRFAREMQSASK